MYDWRCDMDKKVPRVRCRFCGRWTHMMGTKLCDRCWELETRVQADPEIAVRVLREMEFDHESVD